MLCKTQQVSSENYHHGCLTYYSVGKIRENSYMYLASDVSILCDVTRADHFDSQHEEGTYSQRFMHMSANNGVIVISQLKVSPSC